jgi:hypothetical protein
MWIPIAILCVYVSFLPPQITRYPNLNATTHASCGGYDCPGNDGSFFVFEDGKGEMRGRPTYALQCEKTDKGG